MPVLETKRKVIIIGAGVAGLSAGVYLQKNGFDTEIFELGKCAGGLCTAWRRKDYLIDGCIHWFVGCNPNSAHYKIWGGLLDMKALPVNIYGEFCSVDIGGKIIRQWSDADKLRKELEEIAPEDSGRIKELCTAIKRFSLMDAPEFGTFVGKLRFFSGLFLMIFKFRQWTGAIGKYAKKFKNPVVGKFLTTSFGEETPLLLFLLNASWFHNQNAGYPVGGAQELVKLIAQNYEKLGGKINYDAKVEKIIVENQTAKGIQTKIGQTQFADIVISAADGRDTVLNMLSGNFVDRKIKKLYFGDKYEPKVSTIYVSLGLNHKFDESYKPYVFFPTKEPILVDGKEINYLGATIHSFDPKSAPEGKTVMTFMISSRDPKNWIKLRQENRELYDKQKQEVAERVVQEVDNYFGNIRNNLEVLDVATPATYVRYTNNWNGVPMAWQNTSLYLFKPKKEIKGLKNFYMCGQWVGDPGLPGASMSGKTLAQIICKKENIEFRP